LTPQVSDRECELAYDTAKAIDDRLEDVMASLLSTYEQLPLASSQAFGTTTAEILKDLIKHEDSLGELEAVAHELDLDCMEVTPILHSSRF
jgi:hypothetical protein